MRINYKRELEDAARSFLHILWDAGMDVGHSVRTVDEAMDLHGLSLDAWTSMLEGRFVCGDDRVFRQLTEGFRERIAAGPDLWFLRGVFSDMRSRHERFGTSVKLLEPNIKKSAGGLRDMHMPFWLHRASRAAMFVPLSGEQPAILQTAYVGKRFVSARARIGAYVNELLTRFHIVFRRGNRD